MRSYFLCLSLYTMSIVCSQIYAKDINHAAKIYGILGTGTELFVGGVGASYAAEIKIKPEKQLLQAVTVDVQFMGILAPGDFEFNFGGTYGLGYDFDEGVRLIIDVIGIGLNLRSGGYNEIGAVVAYIPPTSFMLNLPGFQMTLFNGFYGAWRNNFSIGSFTEFKTYFAIGFDLSKLYSPNRFVKKSKIN